MYSRGSHHYILWNKLGVVVELLHKLLNHGIYFAGTYYLLLYLPPIGKTCDAFILYLANLINHHSDRAGHIKNRSHCLQFFSKMWFFSIYIQYTQAKYSVIWFPLSFQIGRGKPPPPPPPPRLSLRASNKGLIRSCFWPITPPRSNKSCIRHWLLAEPRSGCETSVLRLCVCVSMYPSAMTLKWHNIVNSQYIATQL